MFRKKHGRINYNPMTARKRKKGMSEKKARIVAGVAAGVIAAALGAAFGVKERDPQ